MVHRYNSFNKGVISESLSCTDFVESRSFLPFSVEVLPSQINKFMTYRSRISDNTRVYLTLLDASLLPMQLAASKVLISAGLRPVVHFPVRAFTNLSSIRAALSSYMSIGIKDILLLGGNSSHCSGSLCSSIDLLESGIMSEFNFEWIEIAGHPEGNLTIERAYHSSSGGLDLFDLLKSKIHMIESLSSRVRILTQFLFEPRPLLSWLQELEYRKVSCPVHVGLAAPASIKTLIKYGIECGVGNSLSFLQNRGRGIAGLFTDHSPDVIYDCLHDEYRNNSSSMVSGLHFYSFGNFEKLFNWLESKNFLC